jgi:hypothetical protein
MAISRTLVWLSLIIAVLALLAAGIGVFWQSPGSAFPFTTVRGETVTIYGQDLYRYDTVFIARGFMGKDAVILLIGVPLLVASVWSYRRGSLRGGLLLLGTLGYFLYAYASTALSAAYNNLFLLNVALFSASFFAFVLAFASFDPGALARYAERLPRRGPAAFMFASALVIVVVWGLALLLALARSETPAGLESYTTMYTHAVDLAIILPAAASAGLLILRRQMLGYLIALSLLVLEIMLAPLITAQTIYQLSYGLTLTPAEIIGPVASFALLGLAAIWVLAAILRPLRD